MIDRRSIPWLGGLVLLALAVLVAASIMLWASSEMTVRSNGFYTSLTGTEQISDEIYDYWNTMSSNAYVLSNAASPLLVGGFTAIFALLAVLARRFDLTRPAPPPAQAEAEDATAAS